MNELTLDGKVYVSSKQAAELTGYAKDYVGQLCREGRVEARLVGRNWYVLKSALEEHRFGTPKAEKPVDDDDFRVNPWSTPRYQPQESPKIELKKEQPVEQPVEVAPEAKFQPLEAISEMQDQWKDWFNTVVKPEPDVEVAADEAPVSVPLHSVSEEQIEEEAQLVETRFNRESTPNIDQESEPVVIRVRKPKGRPVTKALLLVIALFAIVFAYFADGFAPYNSENYWPASVIAGLSTYHSVK